MSNRVWIVCSNLTIAGAGSIDASGKGYEVLSAAYAGEGVWVNAKTAFVSSLAAGAPVTAAFAEEIGADGWAPDALTAVEAAKVLMGTGWDGNFVNGGALSQARALRAASSASSVLGPASVSGRRTMP